jgi:hypothetical protein
MFIEAGLISGFLMQGNVCSPTAHSETLAKILHKTADRTDTSLTRVWLGVASTIVGLKTHA